MYHYVRDAGATPFPDIKAISVADFRQQVRQVKERFATPPLEACIEFLEGSWAPADDICLLTFDDGLDEHHATVAEVLTDAGLPGAFFLPTAAIDEHVMLAVHMNHFLLAALGTAELFIRLKSAASAADVELPAHPTVDAVRRTYRWDDDQTAQLKYLVNHQLPLEVSERLLTHVFTDTLGSTEEFARSLYIDWEQARAMQAAGFHMGGHTHLHKSLSNMAESHQEWDLSYSMDLLRNNLGEGTRGFAYPYGKPATYTTSTIGYLNESGYACAFNTTVDDGRPGTSRWEIPRIDPKDL